MKKLTILVASICISCFLLAGCAKQPSDPAADEAGNVKSPPPTGLDSNPGRPQSERPGQPE